MSKIFVTGTDTDIGKTVVTTLLTEALTEEVGTIFPYKPIQTGAMNDSELSDADIYQFVTNESSMQHCTYHFSKPYSPHLAAKLDRKTFHLDVIQRKIKTLTSQYKGVIIEGAGGLFVPLNEDGYYMIDLIKALHSPVILVTSAQLGTINHTLLSIFALQQYRIPIAGIVFNFLETNNNELQKDNMKFIERETGLPIIGTVPSTKNILSELQTKTGRKRLRRDWQLASCLTFFKEE